MKKAVRCDGVELPNNINDINSLIHLCRKSCPARSQPPGLAGQFVGSDWSHILLQGGEAQDGSVLVGSVVWIVEDYLVVVGRPARQAAYRCREALRCEVHNDRLVAGPVAAEGQRRGGSPQKERVPGGPLRVDGPAQVNAAARDRSRQIRNQCRQRSLDVEDGSVLVGSIVDRKSTRLNSSHLGI